MKTMKSKLSSSKNKQLKTTIRLVVLAISFLAAAPQLMAQQDELNAIDEKLAAGNCEGAQKVYELYRDNYSANPDIERQIAECIEKKKQPSKQVQFDTIYVGSVTVSTEPQKTLTNVRVRENVPVGYTDLGLPSGTLWKNTNEAGYYTYRKAKRKFGNRLPTREQWVELKEYCRCEWDGNKFKMTGPSGNYITFTCTGYIVEKVNKQDEGFYWSSTKSRKENSYFCQMTFDIYKFPHLYINQIFGEKENLIILPHCS